MGSDSKGPVGSIVGGIVGGGLNYDAQLKTNKMNERIANKQMAFQERMSSTAHQREVQDLISAGLNPNLSAGGNGSSTPSGASATMVAPQIDLPAVMSIFSLFQNQQRIDLDKAKAEVMAKESATNIAKKTSETDLTKAKKVLAQKGMIRADLEGEGSKVMKNIIDWMKKKWHFNQPPKFEGDFRTKKPQRRLP